MTVKMVALTQKGKYHDFSGLPCQDAAYITSKGNIHAAVLCDGAGSVSHSEIASLALSNALGEYLCNVFTDVYASSEVQIKENILNFCELALSNLCIPYVESSCTLQFFAFDSSTNEFIYGHIGDGGTFIGNNDELVNVLSYPENGDMPNITYFANNSDVADHIFLQKATFSSNQTSILMTTDGCWYMFYDAIAKSPAPAVSKLMSWLQEDSEEQFKQDLMKVMKSTFSKHSDDDLGVIAICIESNCMQLQKGKTAAAV